ncbi:hypothetical protein [Pseudoalteromonas sp. MB41]|uniref:hypothetical protein n=1 Tax=Pseudoalteromonas sp. MB41 TaxID=2896366 RepID=UPI001E3F491E|nr:hypothetical protein [Pseudoalteromonas sp. MB41]
MSARIWIQSCKDNQLLFNLTNLIEPKRPSAQIGQICYLGLSNDRIANHYSRSIIKTCPIALLIKVQFNLIKKTISKNITTTAKDEYLMALQAQTLSSR